MNLRTPLGTFYAQAWWEWRKPEGPLRPWPRWKRVVRWILAPWILKYAAEDRAWRRERRARVLRDFRATGE